MQHHASDSAQKYIKIQKHCPDKSRRMHKHAKQLPRMQINAKHPKTDTFFYKIRSREFPSKKILLPSMSADRKNLMLLEPTKLVVLNPRNIRPWDVRTPENLQPRSRNLVEAKTDSSQGTYPEIPLRRF